MNLYQEVALSFKKVGDPCCKMISSVSKFHCQPLFLRHEVTSNHCFLVLYCS